MDNNIQARLDELTVLFKQIDDTLKDWNGKGNLKFPDLVGMMAVKLNWEEKQLRENDPLIRYYVRNHTDWYVTRGAHGGIMPKTEKLKKEAAKSAKADAKAQVRAALEARLAEKQIETPDQPTADDIGFTDFDEMDDVES